MVRLTLIHVALVALGSFSVWVQAVYRAPSPHLAVMLTAVSLATTALTLLFWLYAAFTGVGATRGQRRPLHLLSQAFAVVIIGCSFYSLFMFANGKFDLSEPAPHATEIVSIAMEEPTLGVSVPFVWATVRSWRSPGTVERVVLRWDERQRLWGGQPVVVSIRRGFYGTPWVSAIEHDVEKQSRVVLAIMPGAAQIRKDLATFYARLGRFSDAATTTREYSRDFPDDRDFPVSMAKLFTSRDRFDDVITTLADVAPRREDADTYMLLGHALAMQGARRTEGLAYLERAREMQPRNWWPHYALGWAYAAGGDYSRAVPSFERAVALKPNLSDAARALQRLRPLVANAPAR